MSRFQVGDKVRVSSGSIKEQGGGITEVYCEMATIVSQNGISIKVNQEIERLDIAYFKVYDSVLVRNAKKAARFHFKDGGIDTHEPDPFGISIWIPNSNEMKVIINLLKKPYKDIPEYTNWQYACYEWNRENELVGDSIKEYFSGKYDKKYVNNSRLKEAYVPSTQEMPETWE